MGAWFWGEAWIRARFGIDALGLNGGQLTFLTGMKLGDRVAAGAWWRLASSTLVHMDIAHIVFNGYGLWVLGPAIERFYGRAGWISIYLGAGLAGALASQAWTDAAAGGASGAIYGLCGALMVFGWTERRRLPAHISRAMTRGMLPWVVFGIGIGFLDALPMDNAAHIGGLLSGAALALALGPVAFAPRSRARAGLARALAAALALLFVASLIGWAGEFARCAVERDAYLLCYPEFVSLAAPSGAGS